MARAWRHYSGLIVANGAMFSAGLDMSGWAKGRSNPPSLAGICRQIEGCAVRVVVGIHGGALTGGDEPALAAIPRYAAHRVVDRVEGAVLLPFVTGLAQERRMHLKAVIFTSNRLRCVTSFWLNSARALNC